MSQRRADFLIALAGSIVIGMTILLGHLSPDLSLLPRESLCWSRQLLGVDCPGCGLTRSFISLGNGEVARSIRFNWLGVVLLPAATVATITHLLRAAAPRFSVTRIDVTLVAVVLTSLVARTVIFYLR